MRTAAELAALLNDCPWNRMDVHVHTHLCDGHKTMTVENIAARAREVDLALIVLMPHFHKQVSDASETLYEDTDEAILLALREEINCYSARDGTIQFLLSTEVDILSIDGDLAFAPSPRVEAALDFITPTMNYHPLLPLRGVHLTYGRDIDSMHDSGEYAQMAKAAGGIPRVLEAMYETQANAIERTVYTAMLGHFFAAHSIANDCNSWFGARVEDLTLMYAGAERVLAACKRTGAMVDITGIHTKNETAEHKRKKDGFLHDFQTWLLQRCNALDIGAYPGSDTHGLMGIGDSRFYGELFS